MGPNVNIDIGSGVGVAGSALGAFLTTFIVGAIVITVVPGYTQRRMRTMLDEPVGSVLYGLFCLLAILVIVFALVISVIGILFVVPFVVVAYLLWAIGAAIAFLAIGDRLVGHRDGWLKPLLVGAAINGGLTLTAVGGIVTFGIGAAGFGAVLRDLLD